MKAPAVNINATAVLAVLGVAILAAVGVWAWRRFDLGVHLNPLDANNYAYAGASSLVTSALGRDESVGTATYEAVQAVKSPFRWFGGPSTDDIDYSGPVTASEKQLVKNNHLTP